MTANRTWGFSVTSNVRKRIESAGSAVVSQVDE